MDLTQPGTTFDDFKAEVMAKLQHTTDGEAEPVVEARAPVKATHPVDEPSLAESQPKKGEGPSSVHVTTTENGGMLLLHKDSCMYILCIVFATL